MITWQTVLIIFVNLVMDPILLYFTIVFMAELDFVFTKVAEGTCKAVVKGGQLTKFLIQYTGRYFDKTTGEVKEGIIPTNPLDRLWKWLFGGIRIFGIPSLHSIYRYKITFVRKGETVPQSKEYDYVNLAVQNFDVGPKEFLTKERISVIIEYALMLRIVNPYKAMIEPKPNFLQTIDDLVDGQIRAWTAQQSFEEVMKIRGEAGGQTLENIILNKLQDTVLGSYGVKIVSIPIKAVRPEKVDISEAAELEFKEEQKKKAADIRAAIIRLIGKANAEAIEYVMKVTKEQGLTADEIASLAMLFSYQTERPDQLAEARKLATGLGLGSIFESLIGKTVRKGGGAK